MYASLSVSKISSAFNSRRRKCPPFFLRGLIIHLFLTVPSKLRRSQETSLFCWPHQARNSTTVVKYKKKAMERNTSTIWWLSDGERAPFFLLSEKKKKKETFHPCFYRVEKRSLGTRLCYFWWAEKQRAKWRSSLKNGEMFWINNTAIIEVGFRRIWRILQI